jgi:hypothetical protein
MPVYRTIQYQCTKTNMSVAKLSQFLKTNMINQCRISKAFRFCEELYAQTKAQLSQD